MGIGAGTGIGGSAQPPTISETEAQAFHEVNKKVLLAMLPADTFEVISFTKREHESVWKYQTTPEHPLLHPLLDLRMGSEAEIDDKAWQPIYEELIAKLPEEMREILTEENKKPFEERDTSYVVLNNLLMGSAKAIVWVGAASVTAVPNSPEATQNELNMLLPYVALRGGLDHAMSILEDAQGYLEGMGANFSYYDTVSSIISEITNNMVEMNQLRAEIEKEEVKEEIKSDVVRVAHDFSQLKEILKRENQGEDFQILSSTLESLSTVSNAFALPSGSASLMIGLHIATKGLRMEDSGTGVLGSTFFSIVNSVVKGLEGNLNFGTGAELAELNDIKGDLYELLK